MAKVLLISHVASHPGSSGNASRIRSLVGTIEELGHELRFLHLTRKEASNEPLKKFWADRLHEFGIHPFRTTPAPRLFTCCQRLDRTLGTNGFFGRWYWWLVRTNRCTFGIDDWYDNRLNPFLKDLQAKHAFDVVIVAYVFMSKALTHFPATVRKVIDTHDVFADRHQRYFAAGSTPSWYFTTRRQERRGLQRADVVLAIQPEEARYFESLRLRGTRIITVGHRVETSSLSELPRSRPDPVLLFLGSDNDVNRDAVEYLQRELFPIIRRELPQARLVIAGTSSKHARPDVNTDIRGVVDDLDRLYSEATVVLNPIRFGTGLKIKAVEAMAHGKPLVTTSAGVEGLNLPAEEACVVADSTSAVVKAAVSLARDDQRLGRLARNALNFAHELNRQAASGVTEIFAGLGRPS